MRSTLTITLGLTLLISAGAAQAVNCDQVKRYLSTGRTVEQIADTMIVPVDEVKKCVEAEKKEEGTKEEKKEE
jgi:hypothetical protein